MKQLLFFFMLISISINSLSQQCTNGTNAQEFNRKRHWVGGSWGHPYTMFDRHNGISFDSTVKLIRKRILEEKPVGISLYGGPVYSAYQLVYNNAVKTMPNDDGMMTEDGDVSDLALWAKNNAFVFLIGLDGDGKFMDTTEYAGITSFAKRNAFRDRAYHPYEYDATVNAFHHLKGDMPGKIKDLKIGSRSLMLWLTCYDLLKAAYALPELRDSLRNPFGFADADRNGLACTPRNKLRKLTRDLYQESQGVRGVVTHRYGWKKNHGIASAAALLMAAQVLNDAGVETNVLQGNFLFKLFGGMGHNPKYSPVKWHKLGHEGIYENLFEGKNWRLLYPNLPVAPLKTNAGEYSPYSEGPAYAIYGLVDCGIPAMRAEQNFFPEGSNEPLLKKNEINNIFNWLNAIKIGNTGLPTFDNSRPGVSCWELALSNNKDMNYGFGGALKANTADYIALIGGNNISFSTEQLDPMDNKLAETGNIVLRNKTEKGEYYFHMLAEHGIAVDLPSGIFEGGGTHEEPDLGSFMISAGNDAASMVDLGIDPPNFGWKYADYTNKYWMHNVIEIDYGLPQNEDGDFLNPKISKIKRKGFFSKEFTLKYDYIKNLDGFANYLEDAIKRNVIEHKNGENIYYLISDYVNANAIIDSLGDFQGIRLNFNGNGRNGYYNSFNQTNNLNTWRSDTICNGTSWKITSHHVALGGGLSGTGAWSLPQASDTENGTKASSIAGGYLTRLQFFQPGKKKTIFQSAYFPQRCGDSLPTVYKYDEFTDKVVTIVDFVNKVDTFEAKNGGKAINPTVNDTVSHLHLSKWDGNMVDSLVNPFAKSYFANKALYFDGSKIFIERHSLNYMGAGFRYCPPSYIGIRNYITNACSYLIFEDTLFHSSVSLNFDFAILGKEFYQCNITTSGAVTNTDSVKIKLPDVRRGLDMIALIDNTKDTLHGRYDSLTNFITLALKEG